MIATTPASVTSNSPLRHVDVSQCFSAHSTRNKLGRMLWGFVWLFLYRPTPKFLHGWRRFLLRCFGAKIGRGTFPYPSVKIWAPWNLEVGDHCALSDGVDCYCVDRIVIGSHVTISQYTFLCTDDRAFADVDARTDEGICRHPRAIANRDGSGDQRLFYPCLSASIRG